MITMGYADVKKALADGKALEMRKYKRYNEWSEWRPVSAERAARKVEILIPCYDEETYTEYDECPYDFRLAEVG